MSAPKRVELEELLARLEERTARDGGLRKRLLESPGPMILELEGVELSPGPILKIAESASWFNTARLHEKHDSVEAIMGQVDGLSNLLFGSSLKPAPKGEPNVGVDYHAQLESARAGIPPVWSRYALFLEEEQNLLYSSLSNTVALVPAEALDAVKRFRDGKAALSEGMACLYLQLRLAKILAYPVEERTLLVLQKYKKRKHDLAPKPLALTIAPTTACNLACSYCFESGAHPARMTGRTERDIVRFVKRQSHLPPGLSVTWYGGEPLLEWNRIASLTRHLKELHCDYSASIITNLCLLTAEMAHGFDALSIERVQVTLDGQRDTHNQRRCDKNGGPTFDLILYNLDVLFAQYKGKVNLRINVGKDNRDSYLPLRDSILERFQGTNIAVYPGILFGGPADGAHHCCSMGDEDSANFQMELYRDENWNPQRFPPHPTQGRCMATSDHCFLVGPRGELYKCWEDLGKAEWETGHVSEELYTRPRLVALYMVGAGTEDDPDCRECSILPACNGACQRRRLERLFLGEDVSGCPAYTLRLRELVSLYCSKQEELSHA